MIGKFVTKLIQSLPTWEVTKYYGRVCIYQLKCLKYKVQTSEAWFNFKCKFMPGSLQKELECEEPIQKKVKDAQLKQQKMQKEKLFPETVTSQKRSQLQYGNKCKENDCSTTSCSNNDMKNSYFTDEYITNANAKKSQKNEKCQENEEYPIRDDITRKKQRKVKHAQ